MAETSGSGIRKRRTSALTLNSDAGGQVHAGESTHTPTSHERKFKSLQDFKNRQQSFDIPAEHVDECDEVEIAFDSDDEGRADDSPDEGGIRPVTPTPVQDFGVSEQHSEVPLTATELLKVNPVEQDCYTDVSDAETDNEEE